MHQIVRPLKQLLDAGFPTEDIVKEAEKQLFALETMLRTAEVEQAIAATKVFIADLKGERGV